MLFNKENMKYNKFFLFLTFILLITNNIYSIEQDFDESFVLLVVDKNHDYNLATYDLNKLKKCKFPEGPWRDNSMITSDFSKINIETWKKIESASTALQMFCIESPKATDTIIYKNCGFELPGNKKLGYVFNLQQDIKEAAGGIIATKQLDTILEPQTQTKNLATHNTEDTQDPNEIQLDELEELAANLDMTKTDNHENFTPTSKTEIIITKVCVYLLMKSLEVKKTIIDSYHSLKNLLTS